MKPPAGQVETRIAGYADADGILACDPVAGRQRSRVNFIHRAISSRHCHVASLNGRIVGYGVLEYSFFEHGLVSLLCVAPDAQRQGVGTALLQHLERHCRTPKLFITTEQANEPMQRLLEKLDYQPSGSIENLSERGAELVYFKPLSM